MTPEGELYHAVNRVDFEGVNQAIAAGANYNIVRVDGKPLLRIAGEHGHRRICELLVGEGADINEVGGARRYSLLHSAVASSDYGLASILLNLGADASPIRMARTRFRGHL